MPSYFFIVILLWFLSFCAYSSTGQARECRLDQKSDLLQLKGIILQDNKSPHCQTSLLFPRPLKVASWNTSTSDCCAWSGVKCNPNTGDVISINLGCDPQSPSSMYSWKLQSSIKTNDRLSNNSLAFSQDKTSTTPSITNPSFQNLSKLSVLIFDGLDVSSVDPRLFINLPSSLQVLSLRSCKLQGYFPTEVFLLPNLKFLDLSVNVDLHGHLPRSNWSSPMEILDLSSTRFSRDLPAEIGNLKSLNVLRLGYCNFTGLLPSSLGNLTQLITLDLTANKLGGQIPPTFSNLHSLIMLSLSSNKFSGPIPDMFTNMTKLAHLDFSGNMLNASIPFSLLSISSMTYLDLSNNQLSGHINQFRAISLKSIRLFGNQLDGSIPPSISNLSNLVTLSLSSNRFSGLFDLKMLTQMNKMETLDLSHNLITLSNIDHDFEGTLPSLLSLSLSGCKLTRFPTFVRMARNLNMLDLSSNNIQGRIPPWMWEVGFESLAYLNLSHNLLTSLEQVPWVNLLLLDLHSNNIQGLIPTQLPNPIMFLFISNNEFVGHIPKSICQAKNLIVLDLSNNHLNSTIAHCLGNLSNILEVLDLQGNQLSGTIPNLTFQVNNSLRSIHLNRNKLEGQLPRSLMNCQKLEVLDLGMNMFSDTFPSWLDTMPNLRVLVLRSNQFHGTISHFGEKFPFRKLRILDVSFNKFFGLLPETYFQSMIAMTSDNENEQKLHYLGKGIYYQDSVIVTIKGSDRPLEKILSIFSTLDFSSNGFEGPIPDAIGNLISLKGLNISHNRLIGTIPSSLGNLSELEGLDLSSNELVGRIPSELTQLTFLAFLNLSHNYLVGPIPLGKQFNTFTVDSYGGNEGLCGFPLPDTCNTFQSPPIIPQQIHDEDSLLSHIGEFLGVGFLSGLVIGWIVEVLVSRKWHNAIERKFKFFTRSFKSTRYHFSNMEMTFVHVNDASPHAH